MLQLILFAKVGITVIEQCIFRYEMGIILSNVGRWTIASPVGTIDM